MLSTSILINLIAAMGLLGVWGSLLRASTPDVITSRLIWLVGAAAALFITRAVYWITDIGFLERLELILAGPLPLLMLVVTEGVLRRHAPFPVKLGIVAMSILFPIVALIGHQWLEPGFSYAMASTQFSTLVFCLCWLALRDRSTRNVAENRTADIFMFLLVLAGTLILTDFVAIVTAPARLGALGLLMAAYILIATLAPNFTIRKIVTEVVAILIVITILVALAVNSLGLANWESLVRLSSLSLTLFLTAIILLRYFGMRPNIEAGLESTLLKADTSSLEHFLSESLTAAPMRDAKLISSSQLEDYNVAQIEALLAEVGVFAVKPRLPEDVYARHGSAIEQIMFLLDQYHASHIVMVGQQTTKFVLTPVPAFADVGKIRTYLEMMSKIALLIPTKQYEGLKP